MLVYMYVCICICICICRCVCYMNMYMYVYMDMDMYMDFVLVEVFYWLFFGGRVGCWQPDTLSYNLTFHLSLVLLLLLHTTPYIYSLLLLPAGTRRGFGVVVFTVNPEMDLHLDSLFSRISFLPFFFVVFTMNNRRRSALARVPAHPDPLLMEKLICFVTNFKLNFTNRLWGPNGFPIGPPCAPRGPMGSPRGGPRPGRASPGQSRPV